MNIINEITDDDYIQWVEGFVVKVLKNASVKFDKLIIDNFEPDKRIFIFVDGNEYTIRTWNYHTVQCDDNGIPCSEVVEYTLFKIVDDEDGSHGVIVDFGCTQIEWKN